MKCPNCKDTMLEDKIDDGNPRLMHCTKCKGNWLSSESYMSWKKDAKNIVTDNSGEILPAFDGKTARICPRCNKILTRYKASEKADFFLDHCSVCRGVWFDENEWENVVSQNLHHSLNEVFSLKWQQDIGKKLSEKVFDEVYIKKFGSENYEKLKEIKKWIYSQRNSADYIGYIYDKDTYEL